MRGPFCAMGDYRGPHAREGPRIGKQHEKENNECDYVPCPVV